MEELTLKIPYNKTEDFFKKFEENEYKLIKKDKKVRTYTCITSSNSKLGAKKTTTQFSVTEHKNHYTFQIIQQNIKVIAIQIYNAMELNELEEFA